MVLVWVARECKALQEIFFFMMMFIVNDGKLKGKQYLPKGFCERSKQKHRK